jgi:hypothetical protein
VVSSISGATEKHNKYYIGSHWGSPDDGYVCSSTLMKNAYKRRPFDFTRRIISRVTTSRSELLKEEERWLQMISLDEVGKKYYNLNLTTHHWHANPDKLKSIGEKLSKAGKGRVFNEETRQKISEAITGIKRSDDFKDRRRDLNTIIHTGMKRSDETKRRISEAQKARHAVRKKAVDISPEKNYNE